MHCSKKFNLAASFVEIEAIVTKKIKKKFFVDRRHGIKMTIHFNVDILQMALLIS